MKTNVNRQTVDLSQYPNLVVIYLGMRVNRLTGLKTLLGFGTKIAGSVEAQPDGLLLHEPNIVYSLFPPHVGMRQYWRDLESLLVWTKSGVRPPMISLSGTRSSERTVYRSFRLSLFCSASK